MELICAHGLRSGWRLRGSTLWCADAACMQACWFAGLGGRLLYRLVFWPISRSAGLKVPLRRRALYHLDLDIVLQLWVMLRVVERCIPVPSPSLSEQAPEWHVAEDDGGRCRIVSFAIRQAAAMDTFPTLRSHRLWVALLGERGNILHEVGRHSRRHCCLFLPGLAVSLCGR